MSRAIINEIFERELSKDTTKKAWRDDMRSHFGGNFPHKWVITLALLEATFGYNTIYALHVGKSQEQILKLYGITYEQEAESRWENSEDFNENEVFGELDIKPDAEDAARAIEHLLENAEKEVLAAAKKAAVEVYGDMKEIWTGLVPKAGRLVDEGDHYIIIQDKGKWEKTTREIVNRGYDSIVKSLKGVDLDKGGSLPERDPTKTVSKQSAEFKKFSRGTEFHHKGKTTVGASSFAKVLSNLTWKKLLGQADPADQGLLDIIGTEDPDDYFGPIFLKWQANKDATKKADEQTDEFYVEGTIGPRALNPSGDQDTDWKQLGPKLMRTLEKIAQKPGNKNLKGLVEDKGSKSYAQRLQEKATGIMITELALGVKRGGGKPKIQKNFTEEKPKRYKGVSKSKGRGRSKTTKGKPRFKAKALPKRTKKTIQTRRTTSNNISLIALLQAKLPQTVMKNMTGARLHNRSGTFAGSVKAVTMGNIAGKPNIVYTYEEDPYQVFEMGGRGDSRWATPKRDPRYIIDLSIREIAAKMMSGKFTTTRV